MPFRQTDTKRHHSDVHKINQTTNRRGTARNENTQYSHFYINKREDASVFREDAKSKREGAEPSRAGVKNNAKWIPSQSKKFIDSVSRSFKSVLSSSRGKDVRWILDTGASRHFSPILSKNMIRMERPIRIATSNGPLTLWYRSTLMIPDIGRIECVYNPNSPPLVSIGKLVSENNFKFVWSREGCLLVTDSGRKIELGVSGDVPVLGTNTNNSNISMSQLTPMQIDHQLTHMPADPACRVCAMGKMKQKGARRVQKEEQIRSKIYKERVYADCIGPLPPSAVGHRHILVLKDEHSQHTHAIPMQHITSAAVLLEFKKAYPELLGLPQTVRHDGGPEFCGEFAEYLVDKGVNIEKGIPMRPQTHGRMKVWKRVVMDGVRTSLLQAGAPLTSWHLAARHWTANYNMTQVMERTGQVPDVAEGKPIRETVVPYGCLGTMLREKQREQFSKIEPKGQDVVIVGYGENGSFLVKDLTEGCTDWRKAPYKSRDLRVYHTTFPLVRLARDAGYPHFDVYSGKHHEEHSDGGDGPAEERSEMSDEPARSDDGGGFEAEVEEDTGRGAEHNGAPGSHNIPPVGHTDPEGDSVVDRTSTYITSGRGSKGDIATKSGSQGSGKSGSNSGSKKSSKGDDSRLST